MPHYTLRGAAAPPRPSDPTHVPPVLFCSSRAAARDDVSLRVGCIEGVKNRAGFLLKFLGGSLRRTVGRSLTSVPAENRPAPVRVSLRRRTAKGWNVAKAHPPDGEAKVWWGRLKKAMEPTTRAESSWYPGIFLVFAWSALVCIGVGVGLLSGQTLLHLPVKLKNPTGPLPEVGLNGLAAHRARTTAAGARNWGMLGAESATAFSSRIRRRTFTPMPKRPNAAL